LAWGIGLSSIINLFEYVGVPLVEHGSAAPAGLFYNSEVLAEFTAPVFLWTVLTKRWPLVLATALPMVASGSRMAILAVIAGGLYAFRPSSRMLQAGMVLAFLAIATGLVFMLGLYKIETAGIRLVVWGATLLAATPLGNGLGWFQAAHPVEQFAHSDAIQAINELGIGCLFLAAIPVLIMRGNRGSNVERAVFVTICVEVALSFPLHVPGGAFLAAIVAGYLAGDRALVFVGRSDRRTGNEKNEQWQSTNGRAIAGGGGFGRRAFSIRS
jgi:hypothetical protein